MPLPSAAPVCPLCVPPVRHLWVYELLHGVPVGSGFTRFPAISRQVSRFTADRGGEERRRHGDGHGSGAPARWPPPAHRRGTAPLESGMTDTLPDAAPPPTRHKDPFWAKLLIAAGALLVLASA